LRDARDYFFSGSAGPFFVPESKSTLISGSFGSTIGPSQRRKPAGAGFVSQIFVSAFEIFVDVRCFDEARPFLCPATIDPVRRNFLRYGLMKFFGELVFRPGMQLQIQRSQGR